MGFFISCMAGVRQFEPLEFIEHAHNINRVTLLPSFFHCAVGLFGFSTDRLGLQISDRCVPARAQSRPSSSHNSKVHFGFYVPFRLCSLCSRRSNGLPTFF